MIAERAFEAWENFASAGVKRPTSETEYVELHRFMDELTSHHDINEQPWSDLFGLIANYMHEWELENEPELKNPDVPPHRMLAHYMEQQGVSQYQLDKEGIASQQNLSKILQGERGISKELAKKLAGRFGVSIELFI
jgi:HTH-type transcriptional regulator/antitoxin HigA